MKSLASDKETSDENPGIGRGPCGVCCSLSHSIILGSFERFAPLALTSKAASTGLLLILKCPSSSNSLISFERFAPASRSWGPFLRLTCSSFSKFCWLSSCIVSFEQLASCLSNSQSLSTGVKFGSPFRAFLLVFLSFSAASYAQVSVEQPVCFAPNGSFRK